MPNTQGGALLPTNNPTSGQTSPYFQPLPTYNLTPTATTAPATKTPVTSISTTQGQDALTKTVQQATKLGPAPTAPTATSTAQPITYSASGGAIIPTTAQPIDTSKTPAAPTSVTLLNPDTGQKITIQDASINKNYIQAYMSEGYHLSEASGALPDWLTPSGTSGNTTITGSTTPSGNPQLDAANAAFTQAQSDLNDAKSKLTNFDVSNDPQLQGILSGITSSWDQRIADTTQAENSHVAALSTTGFRIGGQYSGGMMQGIVSAEERAAASAISSLESQKQQALTAATQAFQSGKWTQYNDLVQMAQKAYDSQLSQLNTLQTAQAAQDQKLQAATRLANIGTAVAGLVKQGITDPGTILNTINTTSAGASSGVNLTTDELSSMMKTLEPDSAAIMDVMKTAATNGATPAVLKAIGAAATVNDAYTAAGAYGAGGTGTVGDYNFYKAQATAAGQSPVDFNTYQTIDANRKAAASGSGGKDTVSSLAQLLVEGQLAPSELSKRSTGVGSYSDILAAANTYSKATYGVPFNISTADRNYKFANNPTTQNTLNYLGSLIGTSDGSGNFTGGNLQELVTQSNALGRTQFPALNNVAAWARLATGNPAIAAYQATATEVADQIAKILQGGNGSGGTSDAKLQQAANLFATGFSADQIKGVVGALQPLLVNRGTSMIKNNPYLSDYADQFGIDQAGPGGGNSIGSQLILDESAAQNAVINYGKTNPTAQGDIKKVLGETNPATGQPYTYSDAAQILGIDVKANASGPASDGPQTLSNADMRALYSSSKSAGTSVSYDSGSGSFTIGGKTYTRNGTDGSYTTQ